MSTATTLDPAETIRAAVRELHAELRRLVETTDPDDPTLLDKLRKLSTGIRRKITAARKQAEVAAAPEQPVAEPAAPVEPAAAPKPVGPPTAATVPSPSAVVVPAATPAGERVSVRLPDQIKPAPAPAQTVPVATAPHRGRHRTPRAPWWIHTLIVLLMVGGTAVSVYSGTPWWGVGGAVSGWVTLGFGEQLVCRTARRSR